MIVCKKDLTLQWFISGGWSIIYKPSDITLGEDLFLWEDWAEEYTIEDVEYSDILHSLNILSDINKVVYTNIFSYDYS